MTLSRQLSDTLADQRSKQLDLREQALVEKEALLDDSERIKRIEILDKQIAIKEDTLVNLAAAVDADTKNYHTSKNEWQQNIEKLNVECAQLQRAISKLQNERAVVVEDIGRQKQELQSVKHDISDSAKYLKAQEAQVNETVADWNRQLTALAQEAERINEDKTMLAADIIRLKQQKDEAETATTDAQGRAAQLQSVYDEKVDVYRRDLATRKAAITELDTRLEQRQREQEAAAQSILTREQSVSVRESAVNAKEAELAGRERALNMKLNMISM